MTTKNIKDVTPMILQEGFDANGLYFIKMKLHKRIITVTEPKYGVDTLQGIYARQVVALVIPDENLKNQLILDYSSVAAVSSGNVPKAEQFMEMAQADIAFWIEQARKVASQMFSWMDEIDNLSKSDLKKKGRKPLK